MNVQYSELKKKFKTIENNSKKHESTDQQMINVKVTVMFKKTEILNRKNLLKKLLSACMSVSLHTYTHTCTHMHGKLQSEKIHFK